MARRAGWYWAGAAAATIVVVALIVWAVTAGQSSSDDAAPLLSPTPSATEPRKAVEPSKTPEPGKTAAGVDGCVAATMAKLSADERAGQLVMAGLPVEDPRDQAAIIGRYHLGGVFLAGRSKRSAAALRSDVGALQRAAKTAGAPPLLVALDQEGGSVQTLQGDDFPPVQSAYRLGQSSSATLARSVADNARRLAEVGITINLAPVADTVPTVLGRRNPPIGSFRRQFGANPDHVAADIRVAVTGSQAAGVLTTVKHFPGLGRVLFNTDTSTKAVDNTTTATDPYLKPFAAGIEAGTAAVMISSARYPRLDDSNIAAFSKPIVTGLLRERLGFTGLVMSDDLGAAAAAEAVPVGERAVRFVRAGGDLVLTVRPQDASPMSAALTAAAQRSPAFAARVTDAVRHVLRAKYRAGLLSCVSAGRTGASSPSPR
jgi:beta-N-acetylhexosaminidase